MHCVVPTVPNKDTRCVLRTQKNFSYVFFTEHQDKRITTEELKKMEIETIDAPFKGKGQHVDEITSFLNELKNA